MAQTAEFAVKGMSCAHCENAVREEVSALPGVTDIQVSAQSGRLVVTSAEPVEDNAVLGAVDEAGYSATRV